MTWAEKAHRIVAQAIPPVLAPEHASVSAGLWLAGVFLFMLILAALSAYFNSDRRRRQLRGRATKRQGNRILIRIGIPSLKTQNSVVERKTPERSHLRF